MPLSAAHRATRSRVSKRELAAAGQAGEGTGAIVLAAGGELIGAATKIAKLRGVLDLVELDLVVDWPY
jgi:hypothetical protein